MEQLRSPGANEVPIEDLHLTAASNDPEVSLRREMTLECLEHCCGELDPAQRDLIIGYYAGEKGAKIANRKRMAEELGFSLNALGIRAFRIREKLEACVTKCLAARERK